MNPVFDVSSIVHRITGYGYQWRLGQFVSRGAAVDYWQADGYGGQMLCVVPSIDLVVAFAGRNCDNRAGVARLYGLMGNFIVDAL